LVTSGKNGGSAQVAGFFRASRAQAQAHCGAHVTASEFAWVVSKIEQHDSYRG
jgi:hypothetical protein